MRPSEGVGNPAGKPALPFDGEAPAGEPPPPCEDRVFEALVPHAASKIASTARPSNRREPRVEEEAGVFMQATLKRTARVSVAPTSQTARESLTSASQRQSTGFRYGTVGNTKPLLSPASAHAHGVRRTRTYRRSSPGSPGGGNAPGSRQVAEQFASTLAHARPHARQAHGQPREGSCRAHTPGWFLMRRSGPTTRCIAGSTYSILHAESLDPTRMTTPPV